MTGRIGIFTLTILIGILVYVSAQNTAPKNYKVKYTEALRLYKLDTPTVQTDSIAMLYFLISAESSLLDKDFRTAVDCYIKAGNIHQTYQRFAASNQFYHLSLAANASWLRDSSFTYEAGLYLGSSFYFSNIIDSARFYFESASSIALAYKGPTLPEQERLYNSLGAIYFESANYLQAKNYFEKALLVTSPLTDEDYEESFVGINSNIANCLGKLNQYDSALTIYKSLAKYQAEKEIADIIMQNTAHAYYQLGRYDSALLVYRQLPSESAINRIKALNDIGRIYMNRGQWQQSEIIFDSAIAINKRISSTIRNKDEAMAYLYRGQLAARQGLTDEALTWCNEALQEIHLTFKWKRVEDLPDTVSQTVSPIALFEILQTKATILYKKYKSDGRESFLTAALYTYSKAIETANFIKLNFDNDEAKLFFNKNHQPIYSGAIAIAYEALSINKKYMDEYIYILENYKGNVVYQNLQSVELKSAAKIPDSIQRREKEIKQLLAVYTSRINNNAIEKEAYSLQKRLLELQVELSRLQKKYENDESYNQYKYQTLQPGNSLARIQSDLDKETALIDYYVADSVIYLLAINKHKATVQKISTDSSFYRNLYYYIDEMYKPTEGKRYDGHKAAAFLYGELLQPAGNLISDCSKWIIIPDGILYYLPIETLSKSEAEKKYVVLEKTVSYHYSFALLLQNKLNKTDYNNNNAAFAIAPFTSEDSNIINSGLPELPFSKNEVESLGENILLAKNATKQQFVQNATLHSVIHLATHASIGVDSATNWIQFYPADKNELNNKLFVPEIYTLDLHNTELVILSACETAGGITTAGDGLLSLSRAFIYAGSDGIVSTLWKTEDKVTAYLMQQLHRYLKKKTPPEKALQLAKIDLLNNKEIGSQYKTPNYWGNFIYTGKIITDNNKKSNYSWPLLGMFAAICMVIYVARKKISVSIL